MTLNTARVMNRTMIAIALKLKRAAARKKVRNSTDIRLKLRNNLLK